MVLAQKHVHEEKAFHHTFNKTTKSTKTKQTWRLTVLHTSLPTNIMLCLTVPLLSSLKIDCQSVLITQTLFFAKRMGLEVGKLCETAALLDAIMNE